MSDQKINPGNDPVEDDENVSIVTEFIWFVRENKKWWLIPLIVLVVVLGVLAYLTVHFGALMPFIYPVL